MEKTCLSLPLGKHVKLLGKFGSWQTGGILYFFDTEEGDHELKERFRRDMKQKGWDAKETGGGQLASEQFTNEGIVVHITFLDAEADFTVSCSREIGQFGVTPKPKGQ